MVFQIVIPVEGRDISIDLTDEVISENIVRNDAGVVEVNDCLRPPVGSVDVILSFAGGVVQHAGAEVIGIVPIRINPLRLDDPDLGGEILNVVCNGCEPALQVLRGKFQATSHSDVLAVQFLSFFPTPGVISRGLIDENPL